MLYKPEVFDYVCGMPTKKALPDKFSGIFGTSFELFTQEFLNLSPWFLLMSLPTIIANVQTASAFEELDFENFESLADLGGASPLLSFAAWVLSIFSTAFVAVYIHGLLTGKKLSVSAALNKVVGRIVPLLLTAFLFTVAATIGFILLIIPGILISIWGIFTLLTTTLEEKSLFDSFTASRNLVVGNFWPTLGYLLVVYIGVMILTQISSVFGAITSSIIGAILSMFIAIFMTVFYMSRRQTLKTAKDQK